jgi:EAL domain-containing protein (putative c-di-GMP-specific phosphodiesterase class I)
MNKPAHKIAILHDDAEVVGRVTRLAGASGLEVLRPQSFSALINQIDDPQLSAIVLDVTAPRDGGLDVLKRLQSPKSRASLIIIGSMDAKSAEATRKLAASRDLDHVVVLRKQKLDDEELARHLCAGRDGAQRFGPAELDDSLEQGYLRVEYQPKVPLGTSSQFGVEALCRIRHPEFGLIPPDRFVSIAEKCGLIFKLTDAVACEALRAYCTWRQANLILRLAINVSPELLRDGEWSGLFLQRCAEFRVEPKWITLEITESAAGATDPAACEVLTSLRARGFTLSIDDFGTGFSSLATLYRLPVGELKIDKSFILDFQASAGARTLVESTVSMAQRIGLKVVAEGVETEGIFLELREMGIHEAQGYFVGKAMPPENVVPFFTNWKKAMQDPALQAAGSGLPKVAVVQALLTDIAASKPAGPESALAASRRSRSGESDDVRELTQKIPPLVLGGETIAALALCQTAARRLERAPAQKDLLAKIVQLQGVLESELITKQDLEFLGAQGPIRLISRASLTLGRPSTSGRVDIPINCRWLSPGDKNLRLFFEEGDWFIEDCGSTHGYFFGDQRLHLRRPHMLPLGDTVLDIGLASGSIAPLSLTFRRPTPNPDAVVVDFHYDQENLEAEIGREQWPALERDLSSCWICFDGQISAGRSPQGALVLGECTLATAATIKFDNGFWIAPAADTFIGLGDSVFHQAVPLPAKAELRLAGAKLSVREYKPAQAATIVPKGSASQRRFA